jgi:hypothetical protein
MQGLQSVEQPLHAFTGRPSIVDERNTFFHNTSFTSAAFSHDLKSETALSISLMQEFAALLLRPVLSPMKAQRTCLNRFLSNCKDHTNRLCSASDQQTKRKNKLYIIFRIFILFCRGWRICFCRAPRPVAHESAEDRWQGRAPGREKGEITPWSRTSESTLITQKSDTWSRQFNWRKWKR